MNTINKKIYFIIAFSLSAILFFSPVRVNVNKFYYLYYILFFIVLILLLFGYKKPDNNIFSVPIVMLIVAALISSLSATIFWHQSFIDSLKPLVFFMSYILYFLITSWKLSGKDIEKIIIVIGFLYIVVHTIALIYYPRPVFGNISWADQRGFHRIRITGTGFLFLFSFYSLGRYFREKKFLWLSLFFVTLIFIIFTVTRTYIAVSFLFIALFALHKSKSVYKIGAVLIMVVGILVISKMSFFKILSLETSTEIEKLDSNIRFKSADFYLHEFSPNTFTKVFGNGMAYYGSGYGAYMRYLSNIKGLYQTDIGYIGLYSQFGILALLAYLMIIVKTIKVSVSDEYLYVKYFLYFIFVISLIISSSFNTNFIISIILALYILSYTQR